MRRPAVWIAVLAVLAGACGAASAPVDDALDGIEVAGEFELSIAYEGLVGPTQFFFESDGSLVVGLINGGENDRAGQVVRIASDGERTVLFDQLDKPTGLVRRGREIWVMEASRLARGPAGGGELTTVAEDLPNNGRSQGTLSLTPEGDVLFNTSGAKRGATVTEGSARLWVVGDDGEPAELASGFKHAYAHAYAFDGTLWTTEMSDGRFDGEPPQDELLQVVPGADHGWPYCVGQNRPVAEFGQTDCDGVPETVIAFEPGATPTGVVLSPLIEGGLHVALWNRGSVVSVSGQAEPGAGDSFVPLVTGLAGPQHLVAHDGALYISEFGAGRILQLSDL